MRFVFPLLLLCSLFAASLAQAGGITVVEETKPGVFVTRTGNEAPQVVPPTAVVVEGEGLTPKNRSLLARTISLGCTRKARGQPDFTAIDQRLGGDSAKSYCDCMAPHIAGAITMETVKTMFRTRQMDPAMERALIPQAGTCMHRAGSLKH